MAAITWRNINAPTFDGVSRSMDGARKSFTGAFDGLDKMLRERQELAQQQILKQDQQKLLGAQEMLAGATTPEQLAAIQPQVDAIRRELRPETRGQLVGAENKALTDLYSRINATQQHQDQQQQRTYRPVVNQIQAALAEDRFEDARTITNAYADQIQNSGELAGLISKGETAFHDRQWNNIERGWKTQDQIAKEDMRPLQKATAQLKLESADFELAQKQWKAANPQAPELTLPQYQSIRKIETEGAAAIKAANNTLGNTDTHETVRDAIKHFNDKDDKKLVGDQLNQLIHKPEYADITASEAQRLIDEVSTANKGIWGFRTNKHLEEKFNEYIKSDEYKAHAIARDRRVEKATSQFKTDLAAVGSIVGRREQPFNYSPRFGGLTGMSAPTNFGSGSNLVQSMIPITLQSESGNRDYDKNGNALTSPKGAKFAMQTMDATARDPGLGVRPAADDSPEERNRVGRDYLGALVKRYDNDPAKAWAAYNWGMGNVDNAVAKHGDNWLSAAPAETKNYVAKNMNALGVQSNQPQAADFPKPTQQAQSVVPAQLQSEPRLPATNTPALTAAQTPNRTVLTAPTPDQLRVFEKESRDIATGKINQLSPESQEVFDYLQAVNRSTPKSRAEALAEQQLAQGAAFGQQAQAAYDGARVISDRAAAIQAQGASQAEVIDRMRVASQTARELKKWNNTPEDKRTPPTVTPTVTTLERKAAEARRKEEEAKKNR